MRPLLPAFAFLLFAAAPALCQDPDPLALGPEQEPAGMGIAFKVPAGVDPGEPSAVGAFGGRALGVYFGLPGRSPVRVRIETFPLFEDPIAFARLRKQEARVQCREVESEETSTGNGFDPLIRVSLKADAQGQATLLFVLGRFRQVTAVTLEFALADKDVYSKAVGELIGSFRPLAGAPAGLPLQAGWRRDSSPCFEIATDASPEASKALAVLLDASLALARSWFPAQKIPAFPGLVLFHGSAESYSRFREESGLQADAASGVLDDERTLVLGVLPLSRLTRPLAVAEVDLAETARGVFQHFALRAAGKRPEPWFADGVGMALGLGFGPDGRWDRKRAESELALAVEDDIASKRAPSLESLFDRADLGDREKLHAAAWALYLHSGPGQAKKETLQKYFTSFCESWDARRAREAAFGKDGLKDAVRAFPKHYLDAAAKARKTRK